MIVSVVGTRPQFIKAAILSRALDMDIITTGQHYDDVLSGQYFDEFSLTPRILTSNGDVSGMYVKLLDALAPYKTVLVYGDCNTTLSGALAARQLGKRLVHIEAGCRSYNRRMVEESIRITVDHMADLNICPSHTAFWNLKRENLRGVFLGDLSQDYIDAHPSNAEHGFPIVTIHRAENLENMEIILDILASLPGPLVWPQHPKMKRYKLPPNVKACEPVPFALMLDLVQGAPYIVTDSGGLQKEAYMLKTKCITLRDDTEWPETIPNGWNTLAGIDKGKVLAALESTPGKWTPDLYGHDVAQRIAEHVR